jgi:hypothetical protein
LVLTTEIFGVDSGIKDLTFDFPHSKWNQGGCHSGVH